jgi:hypothetical protein
MILAAPLVIPFSKAVPALAGLTGLLGMTALSNKVNEYIQDNPEESMKILSTIIPGAGIGEIFMNKEKISLEDLDEMTDEEAQDLSKEEKAELMKQGGKSKSKDKRQTMIDLSEKLGLSSEGKEKQDIEYEMDERYDEGGVEDAPKPKFDYKKFFRNRRADGGAIGIEVLFEEKKPRKDFNIGGRAQKTNTTSYDPRASIMDYGAALDKVGAGTQAEKSKSLGQYAKNYFTGLGEAGLKKLNPSVRSLAASYGIGKPISKFSELSPQVGQALQGAIMNTIKNPQQRNALTNSNISLKNIPVSSYTSYFKDRGVANTAGLYDTGYNSFADQLKDMAAALAGDASAIARTTYGRFNVDIDPEARTGFLRDTYDFSKKMPGSTAYGINMALPQKFIDEILNSAEYQKATGYKPPSQFPDYKTAALQSQFYKNNPSSLDFDLFKSAYAKATGGPKTTIGSEGQLLTNYGNYDPSRTYSSYMSNTQTSGNRPFFDQFVNDKTFNKSALLSMYGAPGYMKPYYADGGRVGLFMGGPALEGQALNIYNSMNSYGFTDQQIANALQGQGLYTPAGGGGGGGSNEQVTGIIGTQLNRGDDSVTSIAPGTLQKQYQAQLNNPINNFLYETGAKIKASQPYQKSMNLGAMAIGALSGIPGLGFLLDKLGKDGNFNRGNIREMNTPKTLDATKFSDTSGINTDFGGVTVDDLGRIVQTGDYLTAENVMAGYNTGFDLTGTAFDRIDKITSRGPLSDYNRRKVKALKDFAAASAKSRKDALQAEIERAQRIKDEAARSAAVERARVKSISEGYGGHDDSPGATGPTATGAGMGIGGGYATDFGYDFKDGGLATMFVEKR